MRPSLLGYVYGRSRRHSWTSSGTTSNMHRSRSTGRLFRPIRRRPWHTSSPQPLMQLWTELIEANDDGAQAQGWPAGNASHPVLRAMVSGDGAGSKPPGVLLPPTDAGGARRGGFRRGLRVGYL